MPRIKIARKSTTTDMTAMCDVAFLLLTFFILSATAKQPEPITVDTPSSVTTAKQPESDIATITVGQGKVFFQVAGQNIRMSLLEKMGGIYGIQFTDDEKKKFSLIETFGTPIGQLKQFINMDATERNKVNQPGISADSTGTRASELNDWILQSRYATKELDNADMRVSIKGDSKEEYPVIKKLIGILQEQNINKFSLITSTKVVTD